MRSRFAGVKLHMSTLDDNPQFDPTSVYQKAGSAMPEDSPVLDTLAEITAASAGRLALRPGELVTASFKATAVRVFPR